MTSWLYISYQCTRCDANAMQFISLALSFLATKKWQNNYHQSQQVRILNCVRVCARGWIMGNFIIIHKFYNVIFSYREMKERVQRNTFIAFDTLMLILLAHSYFIYLFDSCSRHFRPILPAMSHFICRQGEKYLSLIV